MTEMQTHWLDCPCGEPNSVEVTANAEGLYEIGVRHCTLTADEAAELGGLCAEIVGEDEYERGVQPRNDRTDLHRLDPDRRCRRHAVRLLPRVLRRRGRAAPPEAAMTVREPSGNPFAAKYEKILGGLYGGSGRP